MTTTSVTEAPALPVAVAAADPNIHYGGRFEVRAGVPRCAWSGSIVVLKFNGTDLDAQLGDKGCNYWQIEVDGQPTQKIALATGSHLYRVAEGLAPGSHTVRLVKATEAYNGPTEIQGFQLSAGGTLLPPAPVVNRLEVVGDSITCGDGIEGNAKMAPAPSNTIENAYVTYGDVTAREFGADYAGIAWSGRKMYPDNDMPSIYDLVIPTDKTAAKWDFSKWIPQAVVINLSTNDFGHGVTDEAAWMNAYKAFIARVRGYYPDAQIYCATSVMLGGNNLTRSIACLTQIVSDLNAQGDKKVHLLTLAREVYPDGFGSYGHPNAKTDQIMADALAAQLKADLNWVPVTP